MRLVLIVEDDARTAREIAAALADHGLRTEHAATGVEAVQRARATTYDAIILDRMLPGGLEGLEVLAALRGTGVTTPVLILSALSAVTDRVRGLRAGGDDYLTKPFDFLELTARVDALTRRPNASAGRQEAEIVVGDLYIDLISRTARRAGKPIDLLPREFSLLRHFMSNPGRALTRAMIFEQVWGYHYDERTNVIDVHVAKLRRKLDLDGLPPAIETVRGEGYRLAA